MFNKNDAFSFFISSFKIGNFTRKKTVEGRLKNWKGVNWWPVPRDENKLVVKFVRSLNPTILHCRMQQCARHPKWNSYPCYSTFWETNCKRTAKELDRLHEADGKEFLEFVQRTLLLSHSRGTVIFWQGQDNPCIPCLVRDDFSIAAIPSLQNDLF